MEAKKRILTGDRPTGRLHIGHYVGSLDNRVKLQHDYEQFVIIADVQALTTHFEHPEVMKKNVKHLCIDYLSVGIDPNVSDICIQSLIPQIAELTIFFSMFVMANTLKHNPTIKTEAKQYGYDDLSYGFLGYPVSQAADILFCQADLVPVGSDQVPVVEVTRKIARRFNSLYNPILKEPETLLSNCPRLVGLDGNAKMGKSLNNAIYLSDDVSTVNEKVMKALTDTGRIRLKDKGNPDNCVVNEYHRVFNSSEHSNICEMCTMASIGCTTCKINLANSINNLLAPIQEKQKYYEKKPKYINEVMRNGTDKAIIEGKKTLEMVKEAMSINYNFG